MSEKTTVEIDIKEILGKFEAANKLFIQKLEEKVVKEDLSYREAEAEIFGFDHAQLGALLVKKRNFSQELEKVIEFHQKPSKAKGIVELAAITNFSDKLCNKLRIGFKKDASIVLEELESAVILNLRLPRIAELENELMQALAEEDHFW